VQDDIPYLLLTPGPLTTTSTVKAEMLVDLSTWDRDYNDIVQEVRQVLVALATDEPGYTSVLMQGSGTFSVEATIGSVIGPAGKLLVVSNGAYGARIVAIAERLKIPVTVVETTETSYPLEKFTIALSNDSAITHVAFVHCETTTGMLNPIEQWCQIAKEHGCQIILDAMSSFGGIPIAVHDLGIDFLISSANKCIQGVPGFGFVICREEAIKQSEGYARSVSLDLYDQWRVMEEHKGKWRFTSPTHVLLAFRKALQELEAEGGIAARCQRYIKCQTRLVAGMRELGFKALLEIENHSPIITAFFFPEEPWFEFNAFYELLKQRRFVIYPGKVSEHETFRIGTIGDLTVDDIEDLLVAIQKSVTTLKICATK
jgi:2-aminoethylphosphonate-pyruvate transaminase